MPWQLPEFEREALEHARKLLTESEDYRGSIDLQVSGACRSSGCLSGCAPCTCRPYQMQSYIQLMDAKVLMCRFCLDDNGQERQGLTAHEERWVRCRAQPQACVCMRLLSPVTSRCSTLSH